MPGPDRKQWTNHLTAWAFAVTVFGSLAAAWAFPVFFRTDDVLYLEWAAGHLCPLDAFSPGRAELFGSFRPMQNLAWWGLYRLFGLNPIPYQIVVFLLYGLSFYFFFLVLREMFGPKTAIAASAAYGVCFPFLVHLPFWFSDLTFILELFFIHLSLYFFISAAKKDVRFSAGGIFFYLAAVFSKEPASLLVPAVMAFYVGVFWKDLDESRRRVLAWVALGAAAAGFAFVIFNPYLHARQGLDGSTGWAAAGEFILARWRFYAKRLLAGPGLLLAFSAFYLLAGNLFLSKIKSIGKGWSAIPFVSAVGAAVVAWFWPEPGMVMVTIAGLVLAVRRADGAIAAVWFGLPLLGILTVHFVVRTYLVEASFGFALLAGLALTNLGRDINRWTKGWTPGMRKGAVAAMIFILAVTAVIGSSALKSKLQVAKILSASRMNFRDALQFVQEKGGEKDLLLLVVDYEDMGQTYHRDILPLDDRAKARRQKTMSSGEAERFFRLAGNDTIRVRSQNAQAEEKPAALTWLVAMNRAEKDFVEKRHGNLLLLFYVERAGEGAWVYEIVQNEINDDQAKEMKL